MWNENENHINTNYSVTDCMLCVIPHIRGDVFKNAQNNQHIQVNSVIRSLFDGWTEKELHGNIYIFWSEYKNFNHKNDTFDSNEFIWNSKFISDGNIHLWYQKYSLPSTKVIGFVACRVTSNILAIGYAECSWRDVKTIKLGKISALGSEISGKKSIVFTSVCIEEEGIVMDLYQIESKDGSHSHYWNDEDHAFEYQLDQWGVEELFHNSYEVIISELKLHFENWENWISRTRANYHLPCFLLNMVVWIYMMKTRRQDLSLTTNN